MSKYDYVRSEVRKPAGNHHCHWPGCTRKVAPAVWGCKQHWYMLPQFLRQRIWAEFRPGQEVSKTPSRDYVSAAVEVQNWIRDNFPPTERGMEYDL